MFGKIAKDSSKKYDLKTFFSFSDKAVRPYSMLGVSKYLMEQNLASFSKNFHVC